MVERDKNVNLKEKKYEIIITEGGVKT